MSSYELAILGNVSDADRDTLTNTINELLVGSGLSVGKGVRIHTAESIGDRNEHMAFAAIYFGDENLADQELVENLTRAKATVIPTIRETGNFETLTPECLKFSNGLRRREDDPNMTELAVALLECAGLLRQQRRIFISYRRTESRAAAMQLHDLASASGFDAFLDTHDIRPGEPFQEVLWHRLVDSDVVLMLDTPTYFESKWTRQELGRARAKEIHVLRIVWPAHTPNRMNDLAETIFLQPDELLDAEGPLSDLVTNKIMLAIENLRSRSIASRFRSISGKFRSEILKIGGSIDGIGAHRAMSVRLENGHRLWAYPIVGIPTAELLNEASDRAQANDSQRDPILVYDHVGIGNQWMSHLGWLDDKIREVKAIKVGEAGWALAAWGD